MAGKTKPKAKPKAKAKTKTKAITPTQSYNTALIDALINKESEGKDKEDLMKLKNKVTTAQFKKQNKRTNPWVSHVQEYVKQHPDTSYFCAMTKPEVKATYQIKKTRK